MANDKNIHVYTASDIEKYHRGELSAAEMHELEKAALDDPFLSDALEGYALAGVNAKADLADLNNRLSEKIEGAKIIPLARSTPRNSFRFLRAAVMIVFIAGAAYLVYQFGFNKKDNNIAQADPANKETSAISADTLALESKPSVTAPGVKNQGTEDSPLSIKPTKTPNNIDAQPATEGSAGKPVPVEADDMTAKTTAVTQPTPIAANKSEEVKNIRNKNEQDKVADKKEVAREEVPASTKTRKSAEEITRSKDYVAGQKQAERTIAAPTRKTDNDAVSVPVNTFRGRVTDRENNGVPFANVTNVQDNNAGTYTDARGYFNLTYPDSILNVQVRSIGFESNNTQLRNAVPNNQVVMQDDRSVSEVVLSNQKPNAAARSRDNNLKLEEPEPVDGWVYYDAYLANNLNVPEDLKAKPTSQAGSVDISFEVDKNGEPVNIRVEKSLCNKCDQEAIRLVKAGPKWKRNAKKKGRTTVTINF